jgi:hypothetical protein
MPIPTTGWELKNGEIFPQKRRMLFAHKISQIICCTIFKVGNYCYYIFIGNLNKTIMARFISNQAAFLRAYRADLKIGQKKTGRLWGPGFTRGMPKAATGQKPGKRLSTVKA